MKISNAATYAPVDAAAHTTKKENTIKLMFTARASVYNKIRLYALYSTRENASDSIDDDLDYNTQRQKKKLRRPKIRLASVYTIN